jgi:hypothetical protein
MLEAVDEDESPKGRSAEEVSAKTGGWAQSAKVIQGGSKAANCQFPCAQQAGVYTVQLDMDAPPGTEAQAIITFSVKGQSDVTRQVSVNQGASVSGSADSIKVQVRDYTPKSYITVQTITRTDPLTGAPIVTTQGTGYTVSISIVPGTRPPTQVWGPTLLALNGGVPVAEETLFYFGSVEEPNGTITVDIPQGVGITSYMCLVNPRSIPNPIGIACVQQMLNGPIGGPYSLATSQANSGWTPIINGANQLVVTNLIANVNQYCTIIFGVEG